METDESKPAKARRASRPKVKTGCDNCKLRRVKCDETRPQCRNCVRSGRFCEGYPAYNPRSRFGPNVEIRIPIAPRPQPKNSITSLSPPTSPAYSSSTSSPPSSRDPIKRRVVRTRPRPKTEHNDFTATTMPLTRTPPPSSSFTALEGQYFQVFRTHTANELSGFFDSEFWTRSVLQESHAEASIRHAVVALGALYKTQDQFTESPPGSPEPHPPVDPVSDHYRFALQQYGKSLGRLREALESQEIRSRRTILMSVVLFTCFQSFTGDHKSAITQIQHGLRLLEERADDRRKPLSEQQNDDVEDEMIQMFDRLAVQAKSYDMAFHFPPPFVIRLSPSTSPQSSDSPSASETASTASVERPMPAVFVNIQDARSALHALQQRLALFNEALSSHYAGPNGILPDQIQSTGLSFRRQLEAWQTAFSPLLLNRRKPGVTNTERAGINVLRMTQLMTTILLIMSYSTSEKHFDNFSNEFREIIQLATEVVVDEELALATARCGRDCRHRPKHHGSVSGSSYSHIKASFALDLGIIPPLFVVGTKCRDRKMRREAINLLTSTPRREGMWDSVLCARVADWIMSIEEEGMRPYDAKCKSMEVVQDAKRIMVKEILFDMQLREATLKCGTRGARHGDIDPRARVTHIFW